MAFKLKSIKQKKALLIAGISVFAVAVIGTIAYNMDALNFANLFRLGNSVDEYTDSFTSPIGWVPCQEIDKTATATNKNDTVRYARMKINKYWRTADTETPATDHETTDLSLTWDDNGTTKEYGIINTQNDDKWELRSDGWYYYKTGLAKNESTLSLLKSVTLNCDAKLVENGTTSTTSGGMVAESIPTAYAGSTFHVYVTMQLSDEEWPIPQHQADCDSNILYDTIACQTNGIDDGSDENHNYVDFTQFATRSTGNGNGVNTLAAHARDEYPVYYFRGEVDNNFVAWNNMCWRAFRTTDTGGVKLQLWAPYVISTEDSETGVTTYSCPATFVNNLYSRMAITDSTESYGNGRSLADVGYMINYPVYIPSTSKAMGNSTMIFSNDISYDSSTGVYTLDMSEGQYVEGSYMDEEIYNASKERYHYFCRGGASSCTKDDLYYIYGYYGKTNNAYALEFRSVKMPITPANLDDLKASLFSGNVYDSPMKGDVENWFTENGLDASDLEDTVFCNDRSFSEGALLSIDSPAVSYSNGDAPVFAGYTRNYVVKDGNYHPSVDCARVEDSFTTNSANGNGLSRKPVGIITADEVTLAGRSCEWNSGTCVYLSSGSNELTMTPWNAYYDKFYVARYYNGRWYGSENDISGEVHPVVSLKRGTLYTTGGDGTRTNPYVIE